MTASPEFTGITYDIDRAGAFIASVATAARAEIPYTGDPSPVVDALLALVMEAPDTPQDRPARDAPHVLQAMLQLPSPSAPDRYSSEVATALAGVIASRDQPLPNPTALNRSANSIARTSLPRVPEIAADYLKDTWDRPSPNDAKKDLSETLQTLALTLQDIDEACGAQSGDDSTFAIGDLAYVFGMRHYSKNRRELYKQRVRAGLARCSVSKKLIGAKGINLASEGNPLYYVFSHKYLDELFDDGVEAFAASRGKPDTVGMLQACNDILAACNSALQELFAPKHEAYAAAQTAMREETSKSA